MYQNPVERTLTPAEAVDIGAALAVYEGALPRGREGMSRDLVKAAVDRSMEVMHPLLLEAAQATGNRTVCLGDGWSYGFEDTGDARRPAVFVRNPSGFGYLCVLDLDAGTGPGTPHPAPSVTGAGVHLVRPDHASVREDAYLYPGTLRETLANVAAGGYAGGLIVRFVPDGPRFKLGSQCFLTTAPLKALALLGRVAADAAGTDALAARNAEVGARGQSSLADRPWEIALLEAAAGAVYRDGGFPGDETLDAATRAWRHDLARAVPRMAEEMDQARSILEREGHATRETAYRCNDDRSRMWVQDGPDGAKDAYVEDSAGLFLVRRTEDARGSTLAIARLGEAHQERGLLPVGLAMAYGSHGFLG